MLAGYYFTDHLLDLAIEEPNEELDEIEEEAVNEAATSGHSNNAITRSGRLSAARPRFDELSLANVWYKTNAILHDEVARLQPQHDETERPHELTMVGAGVGGGFINTQELHVMKCDEAMQGPDADKWRRAVEEEYKNLVSHEVFKVVPNLEVPEEATVLSSTWAMKKKSNG